MPTSLPASDLDVPVSARTSRTASAPPLEEVHPLLRLDRDGNIQSLTRAARQLLEYPADVPIDDCFFAHVHEKNHHRVMQDLANMVCRGQQQAQWLVRLRTGNKRWRWYRIAAENRLASDDGRIVLRLRSL